MSLANVAQPGSRNRLFALWDSMQKEMWGPFCSKARISKSNSRASNQAWGPLSHDPSGNAGVASPQTSAEEREMMYQYIHWIELLH